MDINANHGTAIARKAFKEIDVKKGEEGIITAYLPEDDTFAVYFGGKKWITFKETEKEFVNRFNIKRDDDAFDEEGEDLM